MPAVEPHTTLVEEIIGDDEEDVQLFGGVERAKRCEQ
jgi:hypothetical protein